MLGLVVFTFGIVSIIANGNLASAQPQAARLLDMLMYNYPAMDGIRPVLNMSSAVKVDHGMALIEILSFDTDNRLLHASVWERLLWRDDFLIWEPSEYGGMTALRVNPNDIWRPDIKLYNSVEAIPTRDDEVYAVVYNSGDVLWVPPVELKVTCSPSDEYDNAWRCPFKFGSWTFDGSEVDIRPYEGMLSIDIYDFISNHYWKILNTTAVKNVKYYGSGDPYPDITYTLIIGEE